MKKRIVSLIVATVMVLGTLALAGCGCGKGGIGGSGKTVASKLDKEHVFKLEEFDIDFGNGYVNTMSASGDEVFFQTHSWSEDTGNEINKIVTYNIKTKEVTEAEILTGFENEISQSTDGGDMHIFEEEGEAVAVTEDAAEGDTEAEDEDDAEAEEKVSAEGASATEVFPLEGDVDYVDGEGEYTYAGIGSGSFDKDGNLYASVTYNHEIYGDEYVSENKSYIYCWDRSGTVKWSSCTYDSTKDGDADYYYNSGVNLTDDGKIVIGEDQKIVTFSAEDGSPLKEVDLSEYQDYSIIYGRSKPYILVWNEDYTKQNCYEVDINAGKVGNEVTLPESFYRYSILPGGQNYDLLLTFNQTELYTYNFGDAEPVELLDLVDSDVACGGFNNAVLLDDKTVVAAYSDLEDWTPRAGILTKVDPADVVEKAAIVIGGIYIDNDVKKRAIEFNKNSDKYRIQFKDYSQFATADDFEIVYTKLNNDIISGNMPDIIVVNPSVPFDSYINKGLIENLDTYMENDPDFNKDDYLINVFEAFGEEGKIYCVVPNFSIQTLAGKTKDLGTEPGWTMEQFVKYAESLPEDCALINGETQSSFLYNILYSAIGNYVDFNKGTCNFNDGDFANLLEMTTKYFPKEINYDDDDYWRTMENAFRENKAALTNMYLSDFRSFARTEQGQFGEPITLIGYPVKEGNGAVINAYERYAISSTSAAKEGCWEYLKYFLSDEYQESTSWNFPVKISALEKMGKESTERPYWENEDGSKEYYDDSYYINDQDIKIDPISQEKVNELIEFFKNCTLTNAYDDAIVKIITEETEAFYAGQKSAADVCEVIQSRASMYLSENN